MVTGGQALNSGVESEIRVPDTKCVVYITSCMYSVFRATDGSTESVLLVFGVETVLWPTAAKKGGRWYRGVVEAAECFMTRWRECFMTRWQDEAESTRLRHTTEDAKSDDKGRGGEREEQPY